MAEPQRVKHTLSKKPAAPFQVPPPAQAIPGLTGNPPLPGGVPVVVTNPAPHERKVLEALGWKPGMAVPSDLAQQLAAARKAARESLGEMPLPVPADTPPVRIPPETSIDSLPPAKQAELRAALQDAQMQMVAQRQPQPKFASGSVADAVAQAERAVQHDTQSQLIDDDRQQPTYADTNIPKQAPPAAPEQAAPPPQFQTGLDIPVPLSECPHCGWDLGVPDNVMPSSADKQNFLQATLGNLPFEKVYFLMGDQLQVTVRSLRPEELDACYRQIYIERRRGEITTEKDFWESLMRCRNCLQVIHIRTPQLVHELPKSLEEWRTDNTPSSDDEDTVVRMIRDHVYQNVLRTESIVRLVSAVVADFNRLVSKLEANAQNPDFWEPTPSAT